MRFKYLLIILLGSLFLSGCLINEEPDEEVTKISSIQPRAIFLTGKERIPVTQPLYGTTLGGTDTVSFEASSTPYGSFLIFDSEPTEANIKNGNLSGCVAGISSLAGNFWNGRTVDLSNNLYVCNPSDPMAPITATSLSYSTLSGGTYYLLLLGYNENGMLTHSSSLVEVTK